ncbi:MAG: ACP S-malonyltransferase [Bdellovibrionales bacterium]
MSIYSDAQLLDIRAIGRTGTALIFPGLGSHRVGMGVELFKSNDSVREIFAVAAKIWGQRYYDALTAAMASGPPETLNRIEYALPAIFLVSMAVVSILQSDGQRINEIADCVAGHSIGEFAAVTAAGGVPFDEMLRMARCKSRLLQNVVFDPPCAVMAVKADAAATEEAIARLGLGDSCWVANINAPKQTIVSGRARSVSALGDDMKQGGHPILPMRNIHVPVHSPLLQSVTDQLERELESVAVAEPEVPFVASTTGRPVHQADVRKVLARLPVERVDWPNTMRFLLGTMRVGHYVECGPGRVLAALVTSSCPERIPVTVSTLHSYEQIEHYRQKAGCVFGQRCVAASRSSVAQHGLT